MSFGWSVGDLVAALQLVQKVVVALKGTGGASSQYQEVSAFLGVLTVTLQHLKALLAAPLDPDLAKNIEQHCIQVQEPLKSFRERISSRFERDLGAESTRPKFLTAARKLQWALSTSKDVKELEKKIGIHIASIGVILSQQVVQTTLQMPFEIQARIAHTIDTAIQSQITPLVSAVHKEVTTLSASEKGSTRLIEGTVKEMGKQNTAEIQKHARTISENLENKFKILSISQRSYTESAFKIDDRLRMILEAVQNQASESHADSKILKEVALNLSRGQSQSTDIVLRAVRQESEKATTEFQRNSSLSQKHHLSLHRKLDHMTSLMDTVKDHIGSLTIASQSTGLSAPNSEIKTAIKNLQRSVWLLLSALHVLIRELIYLLAPYLMALYQTSIQPLLLYGDHFLFEDAIGRRKWMPCLQFQYWENFYNFLIDSFQGEIGLSRVLNGQFVVLNDFNEVPIHRKAWRAGIQPKSRVTMAILLGSTAVAKGRCANRSCPGQVDFGKDDVTRVCPICGKHLSALKDPLGVDADSGSETAFSFDFGSNIQIPIPKRGADGNANTGENETNTAPDNSRLRQKAMNRLISGTTLDIATYKRVIWESLNEIESQGHSREDLENMRNRILPRHARVRRGGKKFKARAPKTRDSVPTWAQIPPDVDLNPFRSADDVPKQVQTPPSSDLDPQRLPDILPRKYGLWLPSHTQTEGEASKGTETDNASSLLDRPRRRTKSEVAEMQATRKAEIERLCLLLNPPLAAGVLAQMASFQAACQKIVPLNARTWEILKSRLLSEREHVKQQESSLKISQGGVTIQGLNITSC